MTAAPCAHTEVHWHPAKICPGTPDGPGPGQYASQGGICRACRLPVLRTCVVTWSATEAVSGAAAIPRQRRNYTRRYG